MLVHPIAFTDHPTTAIQCRCIIVLLHTMPNVTLCYDVGGTIITANLACPPFIKRRAVSPLLSSAQGAL
jgi:hypothetical protein